MEPHSASPETWVRAHGEYLLNFAYSRLRQREICEDLVQETFLSGYRSLHQYKGQSDIRTWLTAILRNKIADHFRRLEKDRREETDLSAFFDAADHWAEGQYPLEWDGKEPREEWLARCLERLPERMRLLFVLKYIDEKKSEEVCKELDISPSNFWVLMHRGKLQLRKCIETQIKA